jgi:hypothetical protein
MTVQPEKKPVANPTPSEYCPYCAKPVGLGDVDTCDAMCHRFGDSCYCEERQRLMNAWGDLRMGSPEAQKLEARIDALSSYGDER